MWLSLESGEDHDVVYAAVGEGNWCPTYTVLALAVACL